MFQYQKAQSRLKSQADSKRRDLSFNVGDVVFLRLRPYRQKSLAKHLNEKLSPRYFGPYKIVRRVGPVSYMNCSVLEHLRYILFFMTLRFVLLVVVLILFLLHPYHYLMIWN